MSNDTPREWRDATRAIHAGEALHGVNGPVATTIVRSSTFTFASTAEMKRWAEGKSKAYIYTRYGNPTLTVAEAKIAELERAEAAVVAASGMAAISSAIMAVAGAGDEIIATRQLYGGCYRLMRDVLPRFGIKVITWKRISTARMRSSLREQKQFMWRRPQILLCVWWICTKPRRLRSGTSSSRW